MNSRKRRSIFLKYINNWLCTSLFIPFLCIFTPFSEHRKISGLLKKWVFLGFAELYWFAVVLRCGCWRSYHCLVLFLTLRCYSISSLFQAPNSSRFIFLFSLSQFRGPDYLGAWNRPLNIHYAEYLSQSDCRILDSMLVGYHKMRYGRVQTSQTTGEDSDPFTCMRRSDGTTSCPWDWKGGSLSTGVDSGTFTCIELVNPLICPRVGWVSRWWYSWDDVLFGKSTQFMELGNIYNAYICSISIVMEIFLLISWKMLLIVYVCSFCYFSHNNHFLLMASFPPRVVVVFIRRNCRFAVRNNCSLPLFSWLVDFVYTGAWIWNRAKTAANK